MTYIDPDQTDILITKSRSLALVEGVSRVGKAWLRNNFDNFDINQTMSAEYVDDLKQSIEQARLRVEVIG